MSASTIIWTKIDEAPALATYCLFPIVKNYLKGTGVVLGVRQRLMINNRAEPGGRRPGVDNPPAEVVVRVGRLAGGHPQVAGRAEPGARGGHGGGHGCQGGYGYP